MFNRIFITFFIVLLNFANSNVSANPPLCVSNFLDVQKVIKLPSAIPQKADLDIIAKLKKYFSFLQEISNPNTLKIAWDLHLHFHKPLSIHIDPKLEILASKHHPPTVSYF